MGKNRRAVAIKEAAFKNGRPKKKSYTPAQVGLIGEAVARVLGQAKISAEYPRSGLTMGGERKNQFRISFFASLLFAFPRYSAPKQTFQG